MTSKLVLIGVISVVSLLFIYTDAIWMRYPGGYWAHLIFLSLIVGLIWLIVTLIGEIIRLIKNIKSFTWTELLPAVSIIGVLCFSSLNTFSFDLEEKLYGKVLFTACYEGTQNQATFKLKEKEKFEIHWSGAFFYD